jgi:RND family efflux transporter MFP subunit
LIQVVPNGNDKNSSVVQTDIAALRDLKSVVPATGEVLPLLSSIVKSEISGRITGILVEGGDSVQRGDVLVELDRISLQTRVREAERSFEAERLRLERSKRNYERLKELHIKKFVGEKEFLDAMTDFKLSELNLEIAQARLEDAEEDLSKTVITAPHEGILTLINVTDGQVISGATSVSKGTDLLTIAQLSELYMEANINEVDVERIFVGQSAYLRFDAIPDFEVEGHINAIAPAAQKDDKVRVFPIGVVFEVEDNRVRPGISATVEVPIASVEGVVSVLISGVFTREQKSHVYLKTATGWKKQKVELGINNLQHVEIKNGLNAEDVIALSRPPEFRNIDE